MRTLLRYLAATLAAYVLAVVAATQSVIHGLHEMGVAVDLVTRLKMTAHDVLGMSTSLLPLVAAGFVVAFPISFLVARRAPGSYTPCHAAAGATALLGIHLLLKWWFDVWTIFGASTLPGLVVQGMAGAVGGLVFAWTQRRGSGGG